MHAYAPTGMFSIGRFYYPEGEPPPGELDEHRSEHVDACGNKFWICYTKSQFEAHLKSHMGIFFPYIPLYSTGPYVEQGTHVAIGEKLIWVKG